MTTAYLREFGACVTQHSCLAFSHEELAIFEIVVKESYERKTTLIIQQFLFCQNSWGGCACPDGTPLCLSLHEVTNGMNTIFRRR